MEFFVRQVPTNYLTSIKKLCSELFTRNILSFTLSNILITMQ